MNLFYILLGLVIWVVITLFNHEARRKKLEENEKLAKEREIVRRKEYNYFKSRINSIRTAAISYSNHLDHASGYFTNYQLTLWENLYNNLFKEISDKNFENILLSYEDVKIIKIFKNYFMNRAKFRKEYNNQFVSKELQNYNNFFELIEGKKLDLQQKVAIVTDEENNIVIAGAGSGKTTTIVGKVNYVIDRYKVAPEEILLISFTNISASTLAKRIDIEGVKAKTFHKFGKDIIIQVEGIQPSIFDENQYKSVLTNFFNEQIRNEFYLKKVTDYFSMLMKQSKTQFEFKNKGDYIQYLKDQNFRSYKLLPISTKGKITYKMEVVKSIEECKIANFLLFNGIEYQYEYPYEHDTATETFRQYKPDFTIIQNDRKVYIEHFGISRNGDVPNWFKGKDYRTAKDIYHEEMKWKRETHNLHKTNLIETYSYEMSEGTLFESLANQLSKFGIILIPKSPKEIWKLINEAAKDEVSSFIDLFGTFITLMKSNNYSIRDIIEKNNKNNEIFLKKRNSAFIDIIEPIFKLYESYLKDRGEIDFSDMINRASDYINNGSYKKKFRYIIIDEFQDISVGRYNLIKAIKTSNPDCKLFCVGDDWQSIYRFSGSDIALFKEFETYFGVTEKSKIETTYRFNNPLIDISSSFIQKNPNQTRKILKGTSVTKSTEYRIKYSITDNQDDSIALQEIFEEILLSVENISSKHIYILGRYSFDLDRIKNEKGIFKIYKDNGIISYNISNSNEKGEIRRIDAQFLTVHKAKGLEADIVIILNCNSGKHGFPSELSDDQVLNLLLSDADQFENGEERRLFYVAMTRAKEHLYLITDNSYKSKFITELETESGNTKNQKCPYCKTADVVLRKTGIAITGSTFKFYGCSNFLYGCDYRKTEWEN